MSVTDRMTSAVSKIADACEESAKTNKAVQLSWEEGELPQGYLKCWDNNIKIKEESILVNLR